MALRVHPESAPAATTAIGFVAVSTGSLAALGTLLALDAAGVPVVSHHPLAVLHLAAVGVGVTTLLGIGRHMALTTLHRPGPRLPARPLAPAVQALAAAGIVVGLGAGRPALTAAGGALLFALLVGLLAELLAAARVRRQLGAVHGFLAVSALALLAVGALGVVQACDLLRGAPPPAHLLDLHLLLGTAAAFVPAVMGASLQLLPMFSAAQPHPAPWLTALLALLAASLAVALALVDLTARLQLVPALLAPPVALWLTLNALALRRGRPVLADPFFLLGRLGELALVASLVVALRQGASPESAVIYFGGFLVPTVLAYLTRILPFLLWLSLVERHGFDRRIPKVDRYLPRGPALATALAIVLAWAGAVLGAGLGAPSLLRLGEGLYGLALLAEAGLLTRAIRLGRRWRRALPV